MGLDGSVARRGVLEEVADLVPRARQGEGVVVAVDGRDGAGKTHFADDLARVLGARGRPVVRASVDGFHRPRTDRYRRGRDSATGYWLDSYDYAALRECLLQPFRSGGGRRFCTAVHDVDADEPHPRRWSTAPPGAVLCVDAIFLHREELRELWDLSVYLHVSASVSLARMVERDGADPDPRHPRTARYLTGQRIYLNACRPLERATVVVDNTAWRSPRILRRPAVRPPACAGSPTGDS